MQIGLQMFTMREHTKTSEDYTETLRRVAEIGIRSVQATKPAFFTDEEFAALIRSYGMQADSLLVREGQILGREETLRSRAALYGVDAARIDGVPKEFRTSAEGYRRYAAILNEEGRACRAAGLRLMYHFHAYEWQRFGGEAGMELLVRYTDPENVWFQPDVYWMQCAGVEPSSALGLFAGRAFSMHVEDYAIRPLDGVIESVPRRCVAVGEGNMNYRGILAKAEAIGVTRAVIEQEESSGDIFEDLKTNVRNLTALGCTL